MINIGILGCGRIGQVHARSIKSLSGVKIMAVSDAVSASARALAAQTGSEVMSTQQIISGNEIDAVIICTPTDTHYDLIHSAAQAGKAIFCEKPVDLSADRTRDCIKIVEQHNIPFMVAFNRRFDPHFATLKSRIGRGDIGDVELVTILSRDPAPPPMSYVKTSGGLFRDMMIHDLDMARFLLGEEPVSVFATGSVLVDPEIELVGDIDTAAVTLKTASGKICQISNSRRAAYGYDQRIEVHGSKGMLRADNIRENAVEFASQEGFQTAPAQHFFLERYEQAYRHEMIHFMSAIKNGEQVTPGIEDGLRAQILADAAQESHLNNQVIKLT